MSKLLAPNGKPSNLTPEQYKLVRSSVFKKWFGDWENDPENASKVVDENGEPLVVYRGFNKKSDKGNVFKFGVNRFKNNRLANRFGHYFTNSNEVAKEYAEQGEKSTDDDLIIKPYFLNIKKLLNITKSNPKFPSFEQWIRVKPSGFLYSKSDIVDKLKLREIPIHSYLFHDIKVSNDEDIDELSEELIRVLEDKIKKEKKAEKERYETSETISLPYLIKLISDKEINDVLSEYNTEEAETNRDVYTWFINYKKNDKIVRDDLDILLKDLIIKNGFNGGVYREWQFGAIRGKTDLVYFTFESNQIKLADGTNTTFDGGNPDIRFAGGGEIDGFAQSLIDIISSNPQLEKYEKYKVILKDKFGIDFDDFYKDDYYIENANLLEIKDKDDFLNYDKYIEYAYKIFRLRGLIKDSHAQNIEGIVSIDKAIEIGKKLNFIVKHKEYDGGSDNYASHSIDTITIPNKVDINTFIHEIGHHYDHFESKEYKGLAKTSTYASSVYEVGKSDEVFAENFKNYFVAPNWLKEKLPMVYNELDKNINDVYKEEIYKLINSSKEIYRLGGELNKGLFSQIWEWFGIKF